MDSSARKISEHGIEAAAGSAPGAGASADPHYARRFGSLLPFGGRLADALGRKRMFLTGLAGFAAASALGGAPRVSAC